MSSEKKQLVDNNKKEDGLGEIDELIQGFTNYSDTDEGDDDDEDQKEDIDEDAINRELVTWAGRLELESIDLREKAKELTKEITQNSESIKNTSNDLRNEFKSWKESSACQFESALNLLTKSTTNILSASKAFSKSNNHQPAFLDHDRLPRILDTLESTISIVKKLDDQVIKSLTSGNTQITTQLNRKMQTIINAIQKLNLQYTKDEETHKQTNRNLQTLNETMNKCLRRIEDFQNVQIDFGKDLYNLTTAQAKLSAELGSMKSSMNIQRNPSEQARAFRPLTPDSSLNNIQSVPQLQPVAENGKRVRNSSDQTKNITNGDRPHRRTYNTRSSGIINETPQLNHSQNAYQSRKRRALNDKTYKSRSNSGIPTSNYTQSNSSTSKPLDSQLISLLSDDSQSIYSDL